MPSFHLTISGIILAAGTSTRMGRDKLSLPFGGTPILQHVVNAARESQLDDVLVVLPDNAKLATTIDFTGCRVVQTHRNNEQAESLKAGINDLPAQSDGSMILLGDQPLITSKTVNQLIHAFKKQPTHWIVPEKDGQRGNPVIIPAQWFSRVLTVHGDTGARTVMASPEARIKRVPISDNGPFLDVDTPEHYEFLCNTYER